MISCLLALCVGFAAVQLASAGAGHHQPAQPDHCVECGLHHQPAPGDCEPGLCLLSGTTCGASGLSGVAGLCSHSLPVFLSSGASDSSLDCRYRSRLDFAIFRPPIA